MGASARWIRVGRVNRDDDRKRLPVGDDGGGPGRGLRGIVRPAGRIGAGCIDDLVDRLEALGRLDVLESTIAQADHFYSRIPPERLTPESQRHRAKHEVRA